MKKVLSIILSLVFIFALASCKNESTKTEPQKQDITSTAPEKESEIEADTAPLQSESQTKEDETKYFEILTGILKEDSDNQECEKVLKLNLKSEDIEKINIRIYKSSPDGDRPVQKYISDKKTIEKFAELIENTKFYVCENQDEMRKPGTTMSVNIDDKISMSFETDLRINDTYCEKPKNLDDEILKIYNDAPEKEEIISFN